MRNVIALWWAVYDWVLSYTTTPAPKQESEKQANRREAMRIKRIVELERWMRRDERR